MNKHREPVIYTLEHTSFIVDIDKQVLRQTDAPENEISFIDQMADMGDHYLLAWDPRFKNAGADPDQVKPLIIPPLISLDPSGMAEKYGLLPEQLQGKTDFEVIVDQAALQIRHLGKLPEIEISGEKFCVDLRLRELRHTKYFFPVISLRSLELTGDGWHYEAFYEPLLRQVVEIDPKLTEFPNGIVKIRIPNEIGLDPVASAKIYGLDERELLRRYPIQKDLKAKIIPLDETHISRLVRQNRDQLCKEHEEIARRIQPLKRPRL